MVVVFDATTHSLEGGSCKKYATIDPTCIPDMWKCTTLCDIVMAIYYMWIFAR